MLVPKSKFAQIFLGKYTRWDERQEVVNFVADDLRSHSTGETERTLAEEVITTVLEDVSNHQLTLRSGFSQYESLSYRRNLIHGANKALGSLVQPLGAIADVLQNGDIVRNFVQRILTTESWPDELISFVASRMEIDALRAKTSTLHVWEQW
jgi:hypothetical protein